jgi:hypothetical protein
MDTRQTVTLASAASANGNYPSDGAVQLAGGPYQVFVKGTVDGTVEVQLSNDNIEFTTPTNMTFTAKNNSYSIEVGRGVYARAAISGVGSPSPAITVELEPIPEAGVIFR